MQASSLNPNNIHKTIFKEKVSLFVKSVSLRHFKLPTRCNLDSNLDVLTEESGLSVGKTSQSAGSAPPGVEPCIWLQSSRNQTSDAEILWQEHIFFFQFQTAALEAFKAWGGEKKSKSTFGWVSFFTLMVKGAQCCHSAIGVYTVTDIQGVNVMAALLHWQCQCEAIPSLQRASGTSSLCTIMPSDFNIVHFFYLTSQWKLPHAEFSWKGGGGGGARKSAVHCPSSVLLQALEHTTHCWWQWRRCSFFRAYKETSRDTSSFSTRGMEVC